MSLTFGLSTCGCGSRINPDYVQGATSTSDTEAELGSGASGGETTTTDTSETAPGDGDGDDTMTGDGDGDGDGDATMDGDGDGDATMDGDGDATMTGDGDGDGDGDDNECGNGDDDGGTDTDGEIDECPQEGECTFKKPNIMFILDSSTSMNTLWDMDNDLTRWEVTVEALQQLTQPGSFLSQNTHLALIHYGHDPDPNNPGTPVANDQSGLLDGSALDLPWDDGQVDYYPCNGTSFSEALADIGAPMQGMQFGIGTWTKGALDAVAAEIAQTRADHPQDGLNPARPYVNVLLTDGEWTGTNGTTPLSPNNQNPAITAADLFDNHNTQTFVVALAGDLGAEAAADETAAAGGTYSATDADTPALLAAALNSVVTEVINSVVAPECVGGLPRVMVLLDGSSSMLNTNGGMAPAAMGMSGWDQARSALAGNNSLFDLDVGVGSVEDVTHLGLAVFGYNTPDLTGVEPGNVGSGLGEARLLVQYGPCAKDNFAWALDPNTSCEQPGCDDPWAGPPIEWTFQDGLLEMPPGFDQPTVSAMPQCGGFEGQGCSGSGTYTHLGLQLVRNNQVQYAINAANPMAEYPANDETLYFNVLITDGQYSGYSTNAQVQGEMEAMYNNGMTTYVIGFGDGVDQQAAVTQLSNMADWGSNGNESYFDANDQAQLEDALATIFGDLEFDPCCAFNDCSQNPEPTTNEPDLLPMDPMDEESCD